MARTLRSQLSTLLAVLAVPALALAPLVAAGQPAAKPASKDAGSENYDPNNITAISQYMETVVKATELAVAKNNTAAIDTYRKAIQLNPRHPLAYLMLANVYVSMGNLGEAEAAINDGYEAADSKDPLLRSHLLFQRADIFERQKKWDQAKAAWQAYTEHAARFGDGGTLPQSGAERLKALQKVAELEKAYVAVRERIAAEKAAAAASASAAPMPKPRKK